MVVVLVIVRQNARQGSGGEGVGEHADQVEEETDYSLDAAVATDVTVAHGCDGRNCEVVTSEVKV